MTDWRAGARAAYRAVRKRGGNHLEAVRAYTNIRRQDPEVRETEKAYSRNYRLKHREQINAQERARYYETTTIPESYLSPRVKALIEKYREAPP